MTPRETPTTTPTPTPTSIPCNIVNYCFNTTLPSLSGYSGTYTSGPTYNGKNTYIGDGILYGIIYYYTSLTESYWCLSDTLGGTCLLQGASPCYYACPDLSPNVFTEGVCPPLPPVPIDCTILDFNAYFDCEYYPTPTPTSPLNCDVVNFNFLVSTPTPTSTTNCFGKSINFTIQNVTPTTTPTPTPTPTKPISRNINVAGSAAFEILDEEFSCASTKVLIDCNTYEEIYTNDPLIISNVPIVVGTTILLLINGVYRCVIYDRNDENISSNSSIDSIVQIYGLCKDCSIPTSPTPTPTITPTPSPTTYETLTPTPTLTSTPTLTPTSTKPSSVYVYQSCSPIGLNTKPNQVIQTIKSSIPTITENIFKDTSGNCWFYVGNYDSNYTAPITVISSSYQGDYFINSPILTYTTCEVCQTVTPVNTYKIAITNEPCQSSLSSYSISGGKSGDVLVVRARFLGQLLKTSGSFTRADLYLTSLGLGCSSQVSSGCYTDTISHFFNITTQCTITMPSSTTTLTTNADINNSVSNGTVTVEIISVNGIPVSGVSTSGCKNSVIKAGSC